MRRCRSTVQDQTRRRCVHGQMGLHARPQRAKDKEASMVLHKICELKFNNQDRRHYTDDVQKGEDQLTWTSKKRRVKKEGLCPWTSLTPHKFVPPGRMYLQHLHTARLYGKSWHSRHLAKRGVRAVRPQADSHLHLGKPLANDCRCPLGLGDRSQTSLLANIVARTTLWL